MNTRLPHGGFPGPTGWGFLPMPALGEQQGIQKFTDVVLWPLLQRLPWWRGGLQKEEGERRMGGETMHHVSWPGNYLSSTAWKALPLTPVQLTLFIFLYYTGKLNFPFDVYSRKSKHNSGGNSGIQKSNVFYMVQIVEEKGGKLSR